MPAAIAELSREAGVSIGAEGSLPSIRTPEVRGRMSVAEALKRLLRDSGYVARRVGARAWRIERRSRGAASPAPRLSGPHPAEAAPTIPIVVTASKRELRLDELPMAVSVADFGAHRIASAADGSASVAEITEGLALSGLGPGRNRMFLRGVADSPFNGESQSTVAVVLDESRVTYAAPDPDLRLVDVERVEVLKGPQGSLYGTGALGGIYRVVTRKPQFDGASLTVSAGGEAVATGGLGHSLTLVANVPLVPQTAALRLVGYSARDAGWIETGERADSNATNVIGARATVGVALGGGWEAQLGGLVQLLDSRDTQYVYEPFERERPAQLPEPHDNDLRHAALRLSGSLGSTRIMASSGYTSHEVADVLDATIGAAQFGLPDPRRFIDDHAFRVWDSELRANGHWGGFEWLLGLSHLKARQTFLVTLEGAATRAPLTLDEDRRKSTDSALFGDISLPLGPGLRIEAGARLFDSSIVESRITDLGLVSRELTKRGVTPAVSLAWKPQDGRLLFVRYGSAFRPGGADIAGDGTVEPLRSDELATIEAGWRERFAGGGTIELGAYYSRWENIQSDVLQPDGLLESANVGDGEIVGIEATGRLPLGEGWRIDAGAGFTHAVLVNRPTGLGPEHRHLPVVPEYTLRAGLVRGFTLGGEPANIALRLRYLGPARLSFDPGVDRPMGKVLESSLSGRARLLGMDVELEIENLFDRRSDTFAYGNQLRFSSTEQFTPQTPLTARLTLQKSF
ncbi:hypothetical protein B2G71_12610 [Novosphingobium sp. PC22D]|nr:hypothetical protein B2G71_12610 [Novosphingobium sp. PC22D]